VTSEPLTSYKRYAARSASALVEVALRKTLLAQLLKASVSAHRVLFCNLAARMKE
jgi:hypothetical protein